MFLKLFGTTPQEQTKGVISLLTIGWFGLICYMLVVEPLASTKSVFTLNFEVVVLVANLFSLCIGYIAGDTQRVQDSKDKLD